MTSNHHSPDRDEIRQRMRQIRQRLMADVDHTRNQVREITDWKFYVRRFPWLTLGGAAMLAFALVPGRKSKKRGPLPANVEATARKATEAPFLAKLRGEAPADSTQSTMVGSLVGAVGAFALRAASQWASRRAMRIVSEFGDRMQQRHASQDDSRTSSR